MWVLGWRKDPTWTRLRRLALPTPPLGPSDPRTRSQEGQRFSLSDESVGFRRPSLQQAPSAPPRPSASVPCGEDLRRCVLTGSPVLNARWRLDRVRSWIRHTRDTRAFGRRRSSPRITHTSRQRHRETGKMRAGSIAPMSRGISRAAKGLAKRFAVMGSAAAMGRSVATQAIRRQGGASLGKKIVTQHGTKQALPSLARKVSEPAGYVARTVQGGASLGRKAAA